MGEPRLVRSLKRSFQRQATETCAGTRVPESLRRSVLYTLGPEALTSYFLADENRRVLSTDPRYFERHANWEIDGDTEQASDDGGITGNDRVQAFSTAVSEMLQKNRRSALGILREARQWHDYSLR